MGIESFVKAILPHLFGLLSFFVRVETFVKAVLPRFIELLPFCGKNLLSRLFSHICLTFLWEYNLLSRLFSRICLSSFLFVGVEPIVEAICPHLFEVHLLCGSKTYCQVPRLFELYFVEAQPFVKAL